MGFELHCDSDSLELARSDAIWGNVWAEIAGSAFPESNWNDMPVAFLGELIDAVQDVRSASGRHRRVRFFDGPFWIDLAGQEGGSITISVNARSAVQEVVVAADGVARSLEQVGGALLKACHERGWREHADVRRMQTLIGN